MAQYNYDHPNNTVRREHYVPNGFTASATDFAPFRCRQKVLVKAIHIIPKSVGSASDILRVVRNGTEVGSITPSANTSAGSFPSTLGTRLTLTLTANNTLHSLGDLMTLRHDNTGGVYDVTYEYHVLYDSTVT